MASNTLKNLLYQHRQAEADLRESSQQSQHLDTFFSKLPDMATTGQKRKHTFIVEHLDPELEDWQALEYSCISQESEAAGSEFLLSGLSSAFSSVEKLKVPATSKTQRSVEAIYATPEERQRVCLLDPKAEKDLSPEDGDSFDAFLFGGILGTFYSLGNIHSAVLRLLNMRHYRWMPLTLLTQHRRRPTSRPHRRSA